MTNFVGFGLRWYRSFYDTEPALIGPLSKINLLAGQNNSGKSNILSFAQNILTDVKLTGQLFKTSAQLIGSQFDTPIDRSDSVGLEIVLAAPTPTDKIQAFGDRASQIAENSWQATKAALGSPELHPDNTDLFWVPFQRLPNAKSASNQLIVSQKMLDSIETRFSPQLKTALGTVSMALSQSSGGGAGQDLARILGYLLRNTTIPPVETISAFRQITPPSDSTTTGSPTSDHSGKGLVQKLAELEHPDASQRHQRDRFDSINNFLQSVLEDASARIEIPHHRGTINVHRGNDLLPLESLGTGIQQVIILAAAATVLENSLVCIEEPEIHLHPLLQRKLLRYLFDNTSNQYLIATHSAHLLDAELASIFHVTKNDQQGTKVRLAAAPKDQAAICADLGYRPSDLVQANCIIWVEGPSDRIYLRHWIELEDPRFIEGIHYSLMFYGGRLLNHLSPDDPDVDEFISLRRLNRHIAIVIDSDKRSAEDPINQTKTRIQAGFDDGLGFAWITAGYTIENYVPASIFYSAIGVAHPNATSSWSGELYENPLSDGWQGTPQKADKIEVARAVAGLWLPDTDGLLDLQDNVQKCVDFIQRANGMPSQN